MSKVTDAKDLLNSQEPLIEQHYRHRRNILKAIEVLVQAPQIINKLELHYYIAAELSEMDKLAYQDNGLDLRGMFKARQILQKGSNK